MNLRKKTGYKNPTYERYDHAVKRWNKARHHWYRVLEDMASEEERNDFFLNLRLAQIGFDDLAQIDFLSAKSYLAQINERFQQLTRKEYYQTACSYLKKADTSLDLKKKFDYYKKASSLFSGLRKYKESEKHAFYARMKFLSLHENKAEEKSFPTPEEKCQARLRFWSPPLPVASEEVGLPGFRVLVEGGYDLCLRLKLPSVSCELNTTTIITPDGAYQLDEKKERYDCILSAQELENLKLSFEVYLVFAKTLLEKQRQSIKKELSMSQMKALNAALVKKGGHSLEESKSSETTMVPKKLRMS